MAELSLPPAKMNHFSESRWNLLKIRGVAFFAMIFYPLWSPIFQVVFPDAYDPLSGRLIATLPCWIVAALSFKKTVSDKWLERAFNAMTFILTYHVFYLVYKNNLALAYIVGSYCIFFATGAVFSSFRVMLYYFASCLLIGASFYSVENYAILLLLGILCSGAVSIISLNFTHRLLDQLRKSRTQVESIANALDNTLNALGQGFFSFDRNGICNQAYSKACLSLLESDPAGRTVFDVLRMSNDDREFHKDFLNLAFESAGKFDLFADMMPKTFPHSQGKTITLELRPVEKNGQLTEILVIATDETDLLKAKRAAEEEREHMRMVATIAKEKRFFTMFLQGFRQDVALFNQASGSEADVANFRRFLHSVKGATGLFHMADISSYIHDLENLWKMDAATSDKQALILNQVRALDAAMTAFLSRHAYLFGSHSQTVRTVEIGLDKLLRLMRQSDFVSTPKEIRKELIESALVPILNYFTSFSELSQALARSQSKSLLPIKFVNGELAIFPEAYQQLLTSFVHVFRNAVDHGLETREERTRRGKSESGQILVEFSASESSQNTWLVIRVRDDGRGIDPEKIRSKFKNSAALTDHEVIQVIFEPSFTTRETVTEISGRGVGLDALKFAATALGGTVHVVSEVGQFTQVEVRVPYISPTTYVPNDLSLAS